MIYYNQYLLQNDFKLFFRFFIFNGVLLRIAFTQTNCELQNGQCTYNINLSTVGLCETPPAEIIQRPNKEKHLEKEYGKMHEMQQDFNIVKSEHDSRIKELEESVQRLLRNAIPYHESGRSRSRDVFIEHVSDTRPVSRESGGNILLFQLQHQFNTLRKSLSERTADLLETRNKLNETTDLLNAAQKQAMDSNSKLVSYETNAAVIERENRIMKNKLKHKTEHLDYISYKLNASEIKLLSVENQLYDVVRSESNLREELATLNLKFNSTLIEMEELQNNNTELEALYIKTEVTLKLREAELQDCFTAKTQTYCGFEDPDLCGFKQDNITDDFDWERIQGKTPSANTGPINDHTCKDRHGHYMYVEASGKSKGMTAKMFSPKYRGLNPQCIEFYYHMHGRTTGTFTIYSKPLTSDEFRAVWRVFGNQGNLWIKAGVSVDEETARSGYQLIFEAKTENGYEGDISLDDFKIRDGLCAADAASLEIKPPSRSDKERAALLQEQIERYRKILRRRQRMRNERRGTST
ncbi:uncharacterized protein LOC132732812 isoform X2 [Ruditapes philippinarum]|uniref:uncharacterized protein LOC132732812 isoform X2 n=1 Tax=Ruditapes philippinarum TaxID=129788 RepID=UPI00295B98E0|nr:uncharacterized protein LOC132732812 isoform X2 [Ruditapes philippinarum]